MSSFATSVQSGDSSGKTLTIRDNAELDLFGMFISICWGTDSTSLLMPSKVMGIKFSLIFLKNRKLNVTSGMKLEIHTGPLFT